LYSLKALLEFLIRRHLVDRRLHGGDAPDSWTGQQERALLGDEGVEKAQWAYGGALRRGFVVFC